MNPHIAENHTEAIIHTKQQQPTTNKQNPHNAGVNHSHVSCLPSRVVVVFGVGVRGVAGAWPGRGATDCVGLAPGDGAYE